jgi:hypothetical protein
MLTLDGRVKQAVLLLEPDRLSTDPVWRYRRVVFLGLAHERLNRLDEARASYAAGEAGGAAREGRRA